MLRIALPVLLASILIACSGTATEGGSSSSGSSSGITTTGSHGSGSGTSEGNGSASTDSSSGASTSSSSSSSGASSGSTASTASSSSSSSGSSSSSSDTGSSSSSSSASDSGSTGSSASTVSSSGSTSGSSSGSSTGSSGSTGSSCVPDQPLDVASWGPTSSQLVINYAHTVEYKCDWYVGSTLWKAYDYTTCDGWISDEFISSGGEYAIVGWNLVTNAMYTQSVPGQAYNNSIARDCAAYAKQTIFPGADTNNVDIQP